MVDDILKNIDTMSYRELIELEKKVFNSMLSHEDMFNVLKKIDEEKGKRDLSNALLPYSEGIDFD